MIYDIIGDIHGHADKLAGLLDKLGYIHDGISHIAPHGHQAIFIGDFIDRGNQQLATLQIVFDMLDNNQALAVMGNHEYNAICYATQNDHGNYLRLHTDNNNFQHKAFIDETGFDSDLHRYWINRFYELPLWLELDDCICVHACYDKHSMDILTPLLDNNRLTCHAIQLTGKKDTKPYYAIEHVLKGIESPLPDGLTMTDKTGIVRTQARVKWWVDDWQHQSIDKTLFANNLPKIYLNDLSDELLAFGITTDKPIFIGHYWLHDKPTILSDKVVCIDYSAGKDGHLTAYQFDTKNPTLDDDNFVQFIG
ncbi:metallophosphoesterase [Moraxella nonliquefaciens]|uniref:metallophosphoesterase n=1 Tax=Moraxella nonliquefaciens TaxID=478 RepID=UPI00081E7E89|nr:metallophosphoesterase [Moraxella nonliquefaciens]OBX50419.1 phosphoesterase [Moraxella nonliquefaciens]